MRHAPFSDVRDANEMRTVEYAKRNEKNKNYYRQYTHTF
mgnify:CR=1 FL=1